MMRVPVIESAEGTVWKNMRSKIEAKMICGVPIVTVVQISFVRKEEEKGL